MSGKRVKKQRKQMMADFDLISELLPEAAKELGDTNTEELLDWARAALVLRTMAPQVQPHELLPTNLIATLRDIAPDEIRQHLLKENVSAPLLKESSIFK